MGLKSWGPHLLEPNPVQMFVYTLANTDTKGPLAVMYDSDHLYDFKAALVASNRKQKDAVGQLQAARDAAGARLVCETRGMPNVSERRLARHEHLYGAAGVEELLPHLGLSRTDESHLATSGGMRPVARRSSELDRSPSEPWKTTKTWNLGRKILALRRRGRLPSAIADALGRSEPVVRRYLREAEAAGLLAV